MQASEAAPGRQRELRFRRAHEPGRRDGWRS